MALTSQTRRTDHVIKDNGFPTTQLFFLAICRFAEPIALTSILPYAWLMVKDFHIGSPTNASFYAGILISAFSLSESATGMLWGALSDRVGRKPVLLLGCTGTLISLLILGFAQSFWVALMGRVMGGALNGNVGVIQTMVGELVTDPRHEPKAYAVSPFVWAIGTIIGPVIGGMLANPSQNYPSWFSEEGLFGRFPYLLPNLVCAFLLLCSILSGYLFLEETHPDLVEKKRQRLASFYDDSAAKTPLISTTEIYESDCDYQTESYGTFNDVQVHTDEVWTVHEDGSAIKPGSQEQVPAFTYRVVMLVVAMGLYSYHSMTYDSMLPIFLQDERVDSAANLSPFTIAGGVGLSTQTVGLIMSINGLICLFVQAVVFPILTDLIGVWRVFVICTVCHPISYMLVPYMAIFPEEWVLPGIYACLALRSLPYIMAYPVLLILIKQASPAPSVLGRINGLTASVGAAARSIAPPVSGYLYGVGSRIGVSGLPWWGAGFVAVVGLAQMWFVERQKEGSGSVMVRSLAPCVARVQAGRPSHDEWREDVVRIVVVDRDVEG